MINKALSRRLSKRHCALYRGSHVLNIFHHFLVIWTRVSRAFDRSSLWSQIWKLEMYLSSLLSRHNFFKSYFGHTWNFFQLCWNFDFNWDWNPLFDIRVQDFWRRLIFHKFRLLVLSFARECFYRLTMSCKVPMSLLLSHKLRCHHTRIIWWHDAEIYYASA